MVVSLVKQSGGKTKCDVTWLYDSCVPVLPQDRAQGLRMGGSPNRSKNLNSFIDIGQLRGLIGAQM